MVYVTGDTHGMIDFEKMLIFAEKHPALTKKDYVIVAGDFGGVWMKKYLAEDLKRYEDLPFTVLFVDGNHENFDLLYSYPVEGWKGGKIHRVSPHVLHLMRGQVFAIEGKTFFTFGGGTSIDKCFRIEGESWWRREIPSQSEVDEGLRNLRKVGNKVDFIITHSCDERALYYPPLRDHRNPFKMKTYPDNLILSTFEQSVDYGHWYFGHYHLDGGLTDRKTAVYKKFILVIN